MQSKNGQKCKTRIDIIEEGAQHLLQIRQLVQAANASGKTDLREPDLLIVITGGELAYTRPDGVKIIPIGCLRD